MLSRLREFSIDYSDFKAYGPPQNIAYSNSLRTEKGYPDDSTGEVVLLSWTGWRLS